jgi:hypothetical protein
MDHDYGDPDCTDVDCDEHEHQITYEQDSKYAHLVGAACSCGWKTCGYARRDTIDATQVTPHLAAVSS